jgi:hypothetical protein
MQLIFYKKIVLIYVENAPINENKDLSNKYINFRKKWREVCPKREIREKT